MIQKIVKLAFPLTLIGLMGIAHFALAHQQGLEHWHRSGSSVTIEMYNYSTGDYQTGSSGAIADWSNNTILNLPEVSYHSDVSVFDADSGDTGWSSLTTVESWDSLYEHYGHIHLQMNSYYGPYNLKQIQGTYCREVGRSFGLDTSNDGCMGYGYYNSTYYTVAHNWNDIYSMYRYH